MPPAFDLAIDEVQTHRLATEILARSEYAQYRQGDSDWVRALLDALLGGLEALFRLRQESPLLHAVLVGGLCLCAMLLLAHVAWSIAAAMRGPEARAVTPRAREQRDFEVEAAALAERGRYLEGSHLMLLATLTYAARHRLFELKPSDGNRRILEKLRETSLPGSLQIRLIELIARTEALWFGKRVEDANLYAAWQTAYAEFRQISR
jgi:hypothetical protein